ncbi:hypothetical protein Gasu2_36040 [Galdieria sulphuraria]|nr:hypothetical protein Gasu2_36040 [Galdieria sulphuraria]
MIQIHNRIELKQQLVYHSGKRTEVVYQVVLGPAVVLETSTSGIRMTNAELVVRTSYDSEPGDKQNLDACADKVDVDVKQLYDLPAEYSSPMSGDDFGLALERTLLALRNRLDRKDFDKIFDRNDPFIGEL